MPHDPARVEETRAWLVRALHDVQGIRSLLEGTPALPDLAVFHCQQAAEKALKAFLSWHDIPFQKTHNIAQLGRAATAVDPSLAPLVERGAELTPFAWRFRYPGDAIAPDAQDVRRAADLAREVYEAVLARLPHQVAPTGA